MWATHSVVQAVVELVDNPAFGGLSIKSPAASYPWPALKHFALAANKNGNDKYRLAFVHLAIGAPAYGCNSEYRHQFPGVGLLAFHNA